MVDIFEVRKKILEELQKKGYAARIAIGTESAKQTLFVVLDKPLTRPIETKTSTPIIIEVRGGSPKTTQGW